MSDWELVIPMESGSRRALFPDHDSLRLVVLWTGTFGGKGDTPQDLAVVDVGACCGAFSLAVLRLIPQAHIIAFEPSDKAWPYLVHNLGGVADLYNMAASDKDGFSDLSEARIGVQTLHGKGGKSVKTVRLDDVIAQKVHMMKIDVEGHEMEVLDGAKELISEHRPDIIIELSKENQFRAGRTLDELKQKLSDMNYVPVRQLTKQDWHYVRQR